MRSKKLNLIYFLSILFISCGGGGGSGGGSNSSNLPIRNTDEHSIAINNNGQNIAEKIADENKRTLKDVLNQRKNSNETIPKFLSNVNKRYKVGIIDSDFEKNKKELESKYKDLKIIENKTGDGSTHGEEVLRIVMEKEDFKPIVTSITVGLNKNSSKLFSPTKELYEKIFNEFGEQNVKVINHSFGVADDIDHYSSDKNSLNNYLGALVDIQGDREEIESILARGEELVKFYTDAVDNKNALFVWANGNYGSNDTLLLQASINASLPRKRPALEKGWITVIGIAKEIDGKKNIHYSKHYAYPGNAENWAISADAKAEIITPEKSYSILGSSFAAPKVARAATLVAEKFPWMTNNQIRNTLFTTTDSVEVGKGEKITRFTNYSPNSKYGWGMLNVERALKGPGAFLEKILKVDPNSRELNKLFFKADLAENEVSYFENDIYGDSGLQKLGKGNLHLTGNNTFNGNTIVKDGQLDIHKIHSSSVEVDKNGILVLHSRVIIGYNPNYSIFIDENEISEENITKNKFLKNKGTVKVIGNTAIIGGDYIADENSKTELDFSSKVKITGEVKIDGDLKISSDKYISNKTNKILFESEKVSGEFKNIEINGMRKHKINYSDNLVKIEFLRDSTKNYLLENSEMLNNVAENVDEVLNDLDEKINSGIATDDEIKRGASIQLMSAQKFNEAAHKMSAEIYASSQALTFSQAQNINKNLSNRLAGIDNLKNSDLENQVWFSGIHSKGKLKRDGYASGKTFLNGGQFGFDKKINKNDTFGLALAYSYANAKFDKYAGNSKSDMLTFSIYGKKDLEHKIYISSRLGLSRFSTRVKRELVDINADTVKGDIKHNDKMLSFYSEIGKNFENINIFLGYSFDKLRRGAFEEDNAIWGIKSDTKNYLSSNFLIGLRSSYHFNKNKLSTYLTHSINVGNRNLDYKAKFNKSSTQHTFKGIKLVKNTTWLGLELFREINKDFGVFGNLDFRLENGKKADSVLSTGIQYKF